MKSFNFYIWIDEADKTVANEFNDLINEWIELKQVRKMTFITATPESLLKAYGDIEMISLPFAYDRDLYHRFVDSDIRIVEFVKLSDIDVSENKVIM